MITNYLANKFLNILTSRIYGIYSGASYVGLSTTKPTKEGTNVTEVSGNDYARTLIGKSQSSGVVDTSLVKMSNAVDGITSNSTIIYFPESTYAWGACKYLCIFDASVGGNLLAYSPILNPSFASTGITAIALDYEMFANKVADVAATYTFVYDGTAKVWKLSNTAIDILDYGITITGSPANNDTITVVFGVSPIADQVPIIRAGQLKITLD